MARIKVVGDPKARWIEDGKYLDAAGKVVGKAPKSFQPVIVKPSPKVEAAKEDVLERAEAALVETVSVPDSVAEGALENRQALQAEDLAD